MLFMAIFNFDPENREELVKRRLEGNRSPEGIKIVGEWIDFAGGRVFRVFETSETAHLAVAAYAWSDLGYAEVIPIIKTKDALRILKMLGD